jgi:large subunit ribosomal protein L28
MAKRCEICGKGPMTGHAVTRKGKAKKEGGIGQHIARKSIRRFMPNLQTVRAIFDGAVKRVSVCTRCLKKGKVVRKAA